MVERDGVAAHASGMAAGVLNPLDGENIPGPLQPLALEGYRRHLEWWPRLKDETGVDVQGRVLPLLRVAFGDEVETLDGMDVVDGVVGVQQESCVTVRDPWDGAQHQRAGGGRSGD